MLHWGWRCNRTWRSIRSIEQGIIAAAKLRLHQRIDFLLFGRRTLAQFGHQAEIFLIDLRLSIGARRTTRSGPLAATILGNVSGSAARRAHNVVRDVWLVRTQPTLVLRRTAVCASRTVRFTKRSVQLGQLAQLHATQIVVSFGHLDALANDVLDLVHRLLHTLRIGGCDEGVQWFVFAGKRLAIFAADLALFDRALAANDDLGAGFLFHSW